MPPRLRTTAPAAVAALLFLLASCGGDPEAGPADPGATPASLGHVHGLGSDPADGTVYAATHYGVFDLGKDGAGPADLAADPSDPARVLATTAEGVLRYRADGGSGGRLEGAPPLALLDWPTADLLVGITGDGVVHRSRDAGLTWQRLDGPPGALQALDVTPGRWYVATDAGIFVSTDDGRSWQRLTGA